MEAPSYFLSLPENVLATVVFPRLSLDEIDSLCNLSPKFENICTNEELWKIKMTNEYPEFIRSKFPDTTWRYYYYLLEKGKVPLYYHGDRIDYVPFVPYLFDDIINMILSYINDNDLTHIAFIDKHLDPVIVVAYPSLVVDVKTDDYDAIQKIVIIFDDTFNNQVLPIKQIRGRRPIPPRQPRPDFKLRNRRTDKELIFDTLTSNLGHPPIYGLYRPLNINQGYGNHKYLDIIGIDDPNDQFDFDIINKMGAEELDLRIVRRTSSSCSLRPLTELYNILKALKIQPPDTDINIDTVNQELYGEYWRRYSKSQLCDIIQQGLEEIGHII